MISMNGKCDLRTQHLLTQPLTAMILGISFVGKTIVDTRKGVTKAEARGRRALIIMSH